MDTSVFFLCWRTTGARIFAREGRRAGGRRAVRRARRPMTAPKKSRRPALTSLPSACEEMTGWREEPPLGFARLFAKVPRQHLRGVISLVVPNPAGVGIGSTRAHFNGSGRGLPCIGGWLDSLHWGRNRHETAKKTAKMTIIGHAREKIDDPSIYDEPPEGQRPSTSSTSSPQFAPALTFTGSGTVNPNSSPARSMMARTALAASTTRDASTSNRSSS